MYVSDAEPPYGAYNNVLFGARKNENDNSEFVVWAGIEKSTDSVHRLTTRYRTRSNRNVIKSTISNYDTTVQHEYKMTRSGVWFDNDQFASFSNTSQISSSVAFNVYFFTYFNGATNNVDSGRYYGRFYRS